MAPENIKKALASLPADFPPTATTFRILGSMRHEAVAVPALPAPSDPRVAEKVLGAFKAAKAETPAEWMARLERDVRAGTASRARKEHYKIAVTNGYYGDKA
jgi:hypothetical protein